MYQENVIKRVPGDILPPPRKESQGYIDDLEKKTIFELKEILERQEKLLTNKKFISRLPDKGEKIMTLRDKLVAEIEHKNQINEAARLLSRLNIAVEGKAAMTKLEWTGMFSKHPEEEKIVELDSDDDDDDPLHILAQPTGTGTHKKKIIHLPPAKSFLKPEDIEDIESFKNTDPLELEHVKYIVNTVEHSNNPTIKKKGSFKPHKTTKTNVHDPAKEKLRTKHKHWEITAATPPLIVHDAMKTLDIMESLRLEKEQAEKLQVIQTKHAMERLSRLIGSHEVGPSPNNLGSYRTRDDSESSSAEEEHEVHDEEENDSKGTVTFTVESMES